MRRLGEQLKIPNYDRDMIETLIKLGWDINCHESGSYGLLRKVFINDDVYRLNILLEFGFDVNKFASHDDAPMDYICKNSSVAVLNKLLESGMNVNLRDKSGNIPIYTAWKYKNYDFIEKLIEKKVDMNIDIYEKDLICKMIHIVCRECDLDFLNVLIENGAEINNYHRTPLQTAVCNRNTEIVELLI